MTRICLWGLLIVVSVGGLLSAQGPPNPWVRPNCLLGHQPAFVVTDDFTTAGMDAALWVAQSNAATASTDPLVTLSEPGGANGTLTITPRSSFSTSFAYNGYRSVASYDMTNGAVAAEVTQVTSNDLGAQTILSMGINDANYYEIIHNLTNLEMNAWIGDVQNQLTTPYNATTHRWWQVRHVSSDNTIRWETSTDGLNWTERRRLANTLTMTSMRVGAEAGTWQAVTTPGVAIFDNLRVVANLTGYRWYRSTTPGIVPDGTSYVLQQPAYLTSARCPELGLLLGQTRYLVTTVVNSAGTENLTPSNEIQVIVSEGTIGVRP